MFALAVAVGIAEGQSVVALGMAAAPLASLAVVPWALGRRLRRQEPVAPVDEAAAIGPAANPSSRSPTAAVRGGGAGRDICEQTFLNAGPLLVKATEAGDRGAGWPASCSTCC